MLELVVVVFVIVGVDVDVVVVVVVLEVILLALEASCAGIRCEMCLRMEEETTKCLGAGRFIRIWATARRPAIIQTASRNSEGLLSLGRSCLISVHVGWYGHLDFEDKACVGKQV